MNSLRKDIEFNPYIDRGGEKQAAMPIPINERPMDNEYEWKGSPYRLDGWTKPIVTAIQFSADDPQVMWFSDTYGRLYETLDGGKNWSSTSRSMMGARVQNISASKTRTFVLFAQTDKGVIVTRDGGISWVPAPPDQTPGFESHDFAQWQSASDGLSFRIDDQSRLLRSSDGGKTATPCMNEWRIPLANSIFCTRIGVVASGPGGCYLSKDGEKWTELKLWPEMETGSADYLHAYWMGRYYGFLTDRG